MLSQWFSVNAADASTAFFKELQVLVLQVPLAYFNLSSLNFTQFLAPSEQNLNGIQHVAEGK